MKKVSVGYYANLIQIAYNGYSEYRDDFDALYMMYRGEIPDDLKKSLEDRRKSSIFINKAYALVQRLRASTEQAYFTNPSFASFIPLTPYDEAASEEMQKAFDYYWNKEMKPYVQMSKTITSGFTYGTPIQKVYWDKTKPKLENVNIHDVYFDPSAKDFDDIRFMINNIYMTEDDVAVYKKSGIYNKRFKLEDIKSGNTNMIDSNSYLNLEQDSESFGRVLLQDVYEKIEGDWYISTLYNENTLLRERIKLNDGLPFVAGKTVPTINSSDTLEVGVYSDSALAPIYDLQMELNVRVNQEIDAISEVLNPSYVAERNCGINEVDMRKGPSRVVYVQDISKLKDIPAPNISALAMNEERIRTDIEEITGIQMLGSADTSAIVNRQTAEGMNILSGEKSLRTDAYIRTFNDSFIEPLIEKIARLIWKYSDVPSYFKGVDRSKEFAFSVNVAAGLGATSKQTQLNGLNEAFQKFMTLQDTTRAEQTIIDSLPLMGIRNTAEYYEPRTKKEKREEKAQREQQQAQAQKEQMELEKRKIEAEIAKLENENATYLVEAEKAKLETQLMKEEGTSKTKIDLERIAVDNRRVDIEEQKILIETEKLQQEQSGTVAVIEGNTNEPV